MINIRSADGLSLPTHAAIIFVGLLLSSLAMGCATTAPLGADVGDVISNPAAYKNERVRLTGLVIDYEPAAGDTYRTLYFTLGRGPNEKIGVVGAGYTAEAIAKASLMVGKAFEAREPVTVTGKMKIVTRQDKSQAELRLQSVEYKGQEVVVNRGPRTAPGFSVGGFYVMPSIGIGATITP